MEATITIGYEEEEKPKMGMEKYSRVDNVDKSDLFDDPASSSGKRLMGTVVKAPLCGSSGEEGEDDGVKVPSIETVGTGNTLVYLAKDSMIPPKDLEKYKGFVRKLVDMEIYDEEQVDGKSKKGDLDHLYGRLAKEVEMPEVWELPSRWLMELLYTLAAMLAVLLAVDLKEYPIIRLSGWITFVQGIIYYFFLARRFVKDGKWEIFSGKSVKVLQSQPTKIVPSLPKFETAMMHLRREFKISPKKNQLLYLYRKMLESGDLPAPNPILEDLLVTRKMRSASGVIVIAVIMGPSQFSCSYNCSYCPNDPRYSRSYFHEEPTVARGAQNGFDAARQFWDRFHSYGVNGHMRGKIELIILGGTFSCYPPKYAEEFICGLYYAANTAYDNPLQRREMKGILEEQLLNETAPCSIIGVTVETRPDMITKYELRRLRKYGVTRIQMGVQHTDDEILRKNNRECTTAEVIRAMKLCKDECFKIDIHLMPDLPGSSPEKDREMFERVLSDPDLQADQWKIYPTNVLEFTEIKKWYDEGSYKPYAETRFREFLELMIDVMASIPAWIRVNRIQRDFPSKYIEGGNKVMHLRDVLDKELEKASLTSKDIRAMEVRGDTKNIDFARMVRCDYPAQDGQEIFLSFKSCTFGCTCHTFMEYVREFKIHTLVNQFQSRSKVKKPCFMGCNGEDTIYGFLRLRLSKSAGMEAFPDLRGMALIRELHVYGTVVPVYQKSSGKIQCQHYGFGKRLIREAERIAREEGYKGIAVISGVGVREYYRKLGYEIPTGDFNNHGNMMINRFSTSLVD